MTGLAVARSQLALQAVLESVALEAGLHIRLNYSTRLVGKFSVTGLTFYSPLEMNRVIKNQVRIFESIQIAMARRAKRHRHGPCWNVAGIAIVARRQLLVASEKLADFW